MGIKEEVIEILRPIFGDKTVKMIETNYSDGEKAELFNLADTMLTNFMGEKSAKPLLSKLAKKYKVKGGKSG